MKRVTDYSGFSTDAGFVRCLLNEWAPTSFSVSEKQHEDALNAWLQERLPDVPMIAQYGIAKGKADLVIEDCHVIELKLGFDYDSVAEFDRCLGQLERYRQKWVKKERGPVYLVVVGDCDSEFRDLLHTWFKEANEPYFIERFHLIEKRSSKSLR